MRVRGGLSPHPHWGSRSLCIDCVPFYSGLTSVGKPRVSAGAHGDDRALDSRRSNTRPIKAGDLRIVPAGVLFVDVAAVLAPIHLYAIGRN